MVRTHGFSLSWRIIVINGTLFALGTTLLAFTPATVSARPVLSEAIVLLGGLSLMILANSLLVVRTLRPLERLVHDVDDARSTEPLPSIPVPSDGIAAQLATAVNDLFRRIEVARRENQLAQLAGQETERSRVAQELHDGIGQGLTAVLLELTAIIGQAPPELRPQLEETREGARASLEEVRAIARQLRPHILEEVGLVSALGSVCNRLFSGRTVVERSIQPGLPKLRDDIELVIFRVAQEALTNVARHAEADTVTIGLRVIRGELELTIEDDGIGVGPDQDGAGIRGMRERAELVNGRCDLERRPGGGTRVRLVVPLNGDEARTTVAGDEP